MTKEQKKVLTDLMICCLSWEPQVCVLGNVRAGDAAEAIQAVLANDTSVEGTALYTMDQMRDYAEAFHKSRIEAADSQPASRMTDAMGAYLRVCSSGGMPKTTRLAIEGAFAEALRLGYFDEILRTAGGKDSSDARDAERYRWLVVRGQVNSSKIDAAIAGEKK